MRSLWTAATGMKAQQFNIDTISHNLSNANTTSYKVNRAEFKDLFYANVKRSNIVDDGGRPVNLEVGHGTMPVATKRDFRNGSYIHTEGPLDIGLNGSGFFAVEMPNGETRYTRDGSFKLSVDGDEATIVTSEGYFLLGDDDGYISFDSDLRDLVVDEQGYIYAQDMDNEIVDLGRIMLVDFMNPEGLQAEGQNLYRETGSSGQEIFLEAGETQTTMAQGYLEASNVQVVDEMVKMITAQRAYEINSKTITTSDEMMQIANNLKR